MDRNAGVLVAGSTSSVSPEKMKSRKAQAKYFFVFMGALFFVVTFIGFFHSYRTLASGTLIIHWITHIHASAMTGWLVLYFMQAFFAATGNLKIHRRLGPVSVVLSIIVFVFMGIVSIRSIIVYHPPQGSFAFLNLLIDFFAMLCFGLFVTWGMLLRKKNPAAHKRLLTIVTAMVLLAAVDRSRYTYSLPTLALDPPAISFVYLDILLVPIFVYDLIKLKKIHRYTLLGTAIVISLQIVTSIIAGSDGWYRWSYKVTAPIMEKVKEIKLTDRQIAPLLGVYESDLGKLTIGQNSDSIFVQFNDGQKQQLGAVSESELFLKDEMFTFHFTLSAQRDVVAAECRQIGRIYKMKKVRGYR
ncbi:MAG: hypothetical protein JNK79_17970 [Chitinophagaceae bacterium]|nr:hypothetical protein [Chitinophagaceae bacterium]